MRKRIAIAGAVLAVALPSFAQTTGSKPRATISLGLPSIAQMTATRGEAKATIAGKAVSIDYGRPSLKGRDMLAQAQVGQAWRMGANEPTTLKTDADLAFGAKAVPPGEYILTATKVDAQQWLLNFLSKTDRSKVADVPLTTEKLPGSVELFTIDLTGSGEKGDLKLSWGTTALRTTFTAK
jgi:Protein of unknown function (DUF2911)